MKDIQECGVSMETTMGSAVGIHQISPDTIVMIFHRTDAYNETRTTTIPLSLEAFKTLLVLGDRLLEMAVKPKEAPHGA